MKLKDKKIRILECTHTTDEAGFGIDIWKPIHTGKLWAYYRQLSGKEFYASAMVNATEEVVFSINWRRDLDTSMIVEYSGKYYAITRINTLEGYKQDLQIYGKLSPDQDPNI